MSFVARRKPKRSHTQRSRAEVPAPIPVPGYFRVKSVVEWCAALLLLVPALPIIAVCIVLIRATSPGAAVYHQIRVGLHGRTFTMYKLRTMRCDAEAGTGAVWTACQDARITPVGSHLRWLHIDELPQLFNVLKGDMALIGPRPERPEFTHKLARHISGYKRRHSVRPGITGLAQLNLPPDTDLNSVRRKLVLDLEYVRTASGWLDVRIFVATLLRMLASPNSTSVRMLGLRRDPGLSTEYSPHAEEEPACDFDVALSGSPVFDRPCA